MNLYAGRGVAAREYPLTWGSADYLLFVDRQAVGVIEAKKLPKSGSLPLFVVVSSLLAHVG